MFHLNTGWFEYCFFKIVMINSFPMQMDSNIEVDSCDEDIADEDDGKLAYSINVCRKWFFLG